MRTVVLDKFAIVGQSDIDTQEGGRNWSIISLSKQFTNQKRELQVSGSGQIDLVINNGIILACFNLQECKMVESSLAINMIRQCSTCYLTSNGSYLFGMETSGNVFVFTDGLRNVKHIVNPSIEKLQPNAGLYDLVSRTVGNIVGFFSGRTTQVSPNLDSQQCNLAFVPQEYKSVFPYITASSDGLAILCALSPEDCFIFLTSYETALRNRSIANLKESQVPGRWYCINMDKNFVMTWLEGKRSPFFEGKLCYFKDENSNSVIGGVMLYSILEGSKLDIVFGISTKSNNTFTLSWETIQYELDVDVGLLDNTTNPETRFITRLSQDCLKLAIVVSTSHGFYIHVEPIPSYPGRIVKLQRTKMTFCDHWDTVDESTSKRGCYISDVQWLVEDAYFACITRCGCLSIFHATGEPMLIETSHTGEENGSSTFLPVLNQGFISRTKSKTKYPTLKWMDSEKILTCSTANIVEAFSIKRVISNRGSSTIVEPVKKTNNISSTILRSPSCSNNFDSAQSQATALVNPEHKFEPETDEKRFKTKCNVIPVPSVGNIEASSSLKPDDDILNLISPTPSSQRHGLSMGSNDMEAIIASHTNDAIICNSVKKTESTVPTLHKESTCTATISTPNEEDLRCIVTDLRKPCTAPTGQSLETASEANVPLSSVWKTSQTRLLDESSNLELLKQLKFQHQYLKYCQEQGKVNKNVELTKFISSWVLSSEELLPNSSLYDMVLQPNSQQPLRENEKSSRFTMPRRNSREQGKPHKAKSQPLLATLTENRNKTHHLTNSKSIGRFISAKGPPPSAGSSQATIKLQKNSNPRSEKLAFSKAERSSNCARASKSCVTNFSRTQKPKRSISSSSGRSSKIPQRDFVDPFPGKVKITKSSFKRLSSMPAVIGVPSALITYADKQQLQRGFKNTMFGAKNEKSAPTSPNMKRYTPLGENRSGKPQSRKLKWDYSPTRVIKSEKTSLSHFQTVDSFKKADESFLSTVSTAFSGLFRKPNFQELDDLSLKFTISHETLESVQLPATTGRDNNVGEFWLGCDYETERSEYEKPTGEVSFSDPIAIVITVSSTDLPETNHLKTSTTKNETTRKHRSRSQPRP